jgi:hypothetical protein
MSVHGEKSKDSRDPTGRLTAEFNSPDKNGDGTLSSDELFDGLRGKCERDVISQMFDQLDTNVDDYISLDEEYLDYWFQKWQKGGVVPRFRVMLVKGEALLRLAEHEEYI